MNIRNYTQADIVRMKELTSIVFEGVSISHCIEKKYGVINGKDWKFRKEKEFEEIIEDERGNAFVAEEEGLVIGYISTIIYSKAAAIGRIVDFAVDPDHQKKGIGRKLYEAAQCYFKDEGMEYIKIETLVGNETGMHFYPKLGFEEVSRQIHYVKPIEESSE